MRRAQLTILFKRQMLTVSARAARWSVHAVARYSRIMSRRAGLAVLILGSLLAMPACGGTTAGQTDARTSGAAKLGQDRLGALLADLTRAAPQGSTSPQQASTTAARQATISRRASKAVSRGGCKQALTQLTSSYSTFSHSARGLAAGASNDQQYATSAGAVTTAYQQVERTCA
jgi:hypothetical protein